MDEAFVKKILPHSLEAEQSVIGSMIMDKDAILVASEVINSSDFYEQQHGILFDTMLDLFNEGKPVDLVTLQNRLKEKDVPPQLSSLEFIRDLVSSVPTSANVKYYAQIVRDKSVLRRLIKVAEETANECYLDKENLDVILEKTEKEVFNISQNRGTKDFTDIKDIVLRSIDSIEAASKNKGSVTGIATGFYDLDYKTAGLQPSDLILIAARPSMGKTAFALNIAEYVALRSNITTAVFSLEMSQDQLAKRLLAMNSKVDSQNIRTGNLSSDEWASLMEGARVIGNSGLVIDDTSSISISELRSKCRKLKLERNLGDRKSVV